jgi:hypothetical protein
VDPELPAGATTLVEVIFHSVMNRDHVATLEQATSMRIRGVHDPDRRMPGTGFLDSDGAPVMLALTREPEGYRVIAMSHDPDRTDRKALRAWRDRLLAAVDEVSTSWHELSR